MSFIIGVRQTCSLCGKRAVGRRLCRAHYQQAWKRGDFGGHDILGPDDVFDSRVVKTASCWVWTGTKRADGYGIIQLHGGKRVRAHRYNYERLVGPIPEGAILLHSCDNPACVNPVHLRPGTHADNIGEAASKLRTAWGERHGNAKLTTAQVLAIRLDGRAHAEIAAEHGIHQSQVSRIKSGKRRFNE